jgi:hypothetical protein
MRELSYPHSLRNRDEKEAEIGVAPIRDTLCRLENGTLTMPAGADFKTFIPSGGQLTGKPLAAPRLTIGQMADYYLESRCAPLWQTARIST